MFRLKISLQMVMFAIMAVSFRGIVNAQDCQICTATCNELKKENPKLYPGCMSGCEKKCKAVPTPTPEPAPTPLVVAPKYVVMALVYAPPGCSSTTTNQCASATSLVDYSSGSTLGSNVSLKDSFKVGVSYSVDLGPKSVVSASAGFTGTQTNSSSITINKTGSHDIQVQGNGDGIDHGQDQFILMLQPTVALTKQGLNIFWDPGLEGQWAFPYEVYVSELQRPWTMRPGVARQLQALGFTTEDYQNILSLDPYGGKVCTQGRLGEIDQCGTVNAPPNGGSPGSPLDPGRFSPTTWSFPYEPQLASPTCNNGICKCTVLSSTIKNELASSKSTETDSEYTVDLKTSVGVPDVWGLKSDTSLTWTNSNSTTNSTDSAQSATATISCPSPSYTGPEHILVYWDELWRTFLFVPTDISSSVAVHRGKVLNKLGKPMQGQLVNLSYGGKTYHTVTGIDGSYDFFAAPGTKVTTKTGQLKIGIVAKTVSLGTKAIVTTRTQ